MKALRTRLGIWATCVSVALPRLLAAAATDGTATFDVTINQDGGNYAPRHVLAIWVVDSAGRFMKTVRKQANARQGYLYQWNAARAGWNGVDGVSTATVNTYPPITVTWNGRDTNNVLQPDGTYRFFVEFTERNGQGYWTTNGIAFTKGPTAATNTYADQPYIRSMKVTWVPSVTHDVAVTALEPTVGQSDTIVPITVTITNLTALSESFSVVLSNLTWPSLIGTQQVNGLAGHRATNVVIPWNTTGLATGAYVLRAWAGPVPDEGSTDDNSRTNVVLLRHPTHDVAVARILAPAVVLPGSQTNVTVAVTNTGEFAESFGLTLYDDTDARFLGSNFVNNLVAYSGRDVTFSWRVTNSIIGYHLLRAVAAPVSGETHLADNTNTLVVPVAHGLETNTLIARKSLWRYDDSGADLTLTPWKQSGFYDGGWKLGGGPLGLYNNGLVTTLAGGRTNYYFRRTFHVDFPPLSLTLRLQADDGAVVYLNNREVLRTNLPAGPVGAFTSAIYNVGGTAETNYFEFSLAASNVAVGPNIIAVEVHQCSVSNSTDIGFDLELTQVNSQVPHVDDVDVLAVEPGAAVRPGDRLPVLVTLTNRGNVTETFTVVLQDTTTGQVLGSQVVSNLPPATASAVSFQWSTLGASGGAHALQAYTIIGNVTNLAGAGTASASILDSGFGLRAVHAAGSIGGRCAAVAATANLLLVGAGATLEVWDRANPVALVKLGAVRLPGLIRGLAVGGTSAFAACGDAGVQFVDLSNPSSPAHVNGFDSSGHAYAVAVSGNYLYLADGVAGVRVLDVANLAAPTLAGAYYTEGPASAITVAGTRAYVLDLHKGLLILNLANPAAPSLLGASAAFDVGTAVAVSGTTVYAVDGHGRFNVFNAANPAAPSLLGSVYLGAVGQALAVNGTTAYVAAGELGLLTVNAATPSAPVIVNTNAVPGSASWLSLAGTTLYLADGFAGFQILDVTAADDPVLQADFATALRACDVAVNNGLAYVAAGETGLRIFAVTNPAAPVLVGTCPAVGNARCIALAGTTGYVGDGQYGLKILDLANPAAPALRGAYSNAELASIRDIAVAGSRVLVSDGRKLGLLDVTVPGNPALVATHEAPAFAYAVAVAGSRAYVACGSAGLVILNIGPASLTVAGSYDTPGLASGVSLAGTTAYVADGPGGWLALNVANPAAPTLIGTSTAQGPVSDIAVSGLLATLASGANAARTLDVSTPLTPVLRETFEPLVHALRVGSGGAHTLVAEDEAGLAILLTGGGDDTDGDGLSDAWEQQIVDADPNDTIRSIADVWPEADFDGDRLSNRAEAIAGTSPIDPASKFIQSAPQAVGASEVVLRWSSVAGKTYTLHKAAALDGTWAVVVDDIPATPPENTLTMTNDGAAAFFIISVR